MVMAARPTEPNRPRRLRRIRRLLRPVRARLRLLRMLGVMVAGYGITAVIPARFDRGLSRMFSWVYLGTHRRMVRIIADRMGAALGSSDGSRDWNVLAGDNLRMRMEEDLGRLRGMHRTGWRPDIELVGIEHLERALEQGRGVVLWRMSFASSPIAKVALWDAGHPLVHLSAPWHGTYWWQGRWRSRFSRWYAASENRFLKERIIRSQGADLGYLRTLMARLRSNEVVSIFGDVAGGRQNYERRIAGETIRFAPGAASLGRKVGSALLPVYVVWLGPQRYRVVIEAPIEVDRTLPRDQFVRRAVVEFAGRLELRIREHPASWRGWHAAGRPPSQ